MNYRANLTSAIAFGAVLGCGMLGYAPTARASLDACGDIYVEAEATCVVEVEGGCEVQCEPVRMEAACAAELYADCDGECTASASIDCQTDCTVGCEADCEVDPGTFECQTDCTAECTGSCSASCDSDDSECRASCEATCSGSCDTRCGGTPPSASCEAKCEASCEGSCEAEANIDCQVDCQAEGYVTCKADLQGGCEAQCERPEGALFCDGQYVDHGGALEECIAAIESTLDVEVEGEASAMCTDGRCEASAEGAIACAVDPRREHTPLALWLVSGLGLLGSVARRRRAHRVQPTR